MSSHAHEPAAGALRDPEVAARVEQLYASHAALVRSVCRSLLRDPVEAEDGVQQTFLSAQRALLNGSQPRDAAAWLATIARHEALARVRTRMREPLPAEMEQLGAAPDAHIAAARSHDARELRDALAELPQQQREAILLRELRGLSYQEVAATLSVTTAAVESLLFRARRTLQTRLREALASLSPAPLVQPLRESLARILGGGLMAPTAAKLAAVGVGTVAVTGGAVVDPTVLGLGHAPRPAVRSARPTHHSTVRGTPPTTHVALPTWAAPQPGQVVVVRKPQPVQRSDGAVSEARSEPADGASGTPEHERPAARTDGATVEARSATSGSTRETSDDHATTQAPTRSAESSSTSTSTATATADSGSSDSSSGAAATGSRTTDD